MGAELGRDVTGWQFFMAGDDSSSGRGYDWPWLPTTATHHGYHDAAAVLTTVALLAQVRNLVAALPSAAGSPRSADTWHGKILLWWFFMVNVFLGFYKVLSNNNMVLIANNRLTGFCI